MNTNATKHKESNINKIVNDSNWHNLTDVSKGKFTLKKGKTNHNIEEITSHLQQLAQSDDETLNFDTQEENNQLGNTNFKIKKARKTKEQNINEKDSHSTSNIEKEVATEEFAHNLLKKDQIIKKEETDQQTSVTKHEDAATNVNSVLPQTNNVTSSSPTKNKSHNAMQGLLKFAALGFAHLYVKKTTSVLKPLGFVAENIEKVSMGFMHLIIPLIMTWLITTKVEFFSSQLQQMGTLPVILCNIAFYVACVFLWVSTQVIFAGLLNVCKKTLRDVAKVGEENR